MQFLNKGLIAAGQIYPMFVPAPIDLLKPGILKIIIKTIKMTQKVSKLKENYIPEIIGAVIGNMILSAVTDPIKNAVIQSSIQAASDPKEEDDRTWPNEKVEMVDGRMVREMRVVFHEANRAGPHLDVHIGRLSLIVKVPKDVNKTLKYNSSGSLTEKSRESLIELIRNQTSKGFSLAQNRDHTVRDANITWLRGQPGLEGYGAGTTRQSILIEPVEFLSVSGDTIRMYAPSLYKHGQLYLHRLGNSDDKSAPIIMWGQAKAPEMESGDKVHLKKFRADEIDKFVEKVDPKTLTVKRDGASAFFKSDDKTELWSPRISKDTGKHIEYAHKIPEIFRVKSPVEVVGMGEIEFRRKFDILNPFADRKMSAAQIGGILNADRVRPLNVIPEFRIYRIDKFGGKDVVNLNFFENRSLAERFIKLIGNKAIMVPEFSSLKKKPGVEGIVGIPKGGSVSDGFAVKWVEDPLDWELELVNLKRGDKGRIAGVVWFKSLESGKKFKMGASQIGNDEIVNAIMNDPDKFIGKVYKVAGKVGHEGRAAKVIEPHLDKGVD